MKKILLLPLLFISVISFGQLFTDKYDGETYFKDKRNGLIYKTMKIGKQIWFAENLEFKMGNYWLKTHHTEFSTADPFEESIETMYLGGAATVDATEKNKDNIPIYGYLYDWYTANKVCPTGWHLPGYWDWEYLQENIRYPNTPTENEFNRQSGASGWWSSLDYDAINAWYRGPLDTKGDPDRGKIWKTDGCAVRCVKDL